MVQPWEVGAAGRLWRAGLVLTNRRVVLLKLGGVLHRTASILGERELQDLPVMTVEKGLGGSPMALLGENIFPISLGNDARPLASEINHQRERVLAQESGGKGEEQPAPERIVTHRETVTREIVKVPCRYCGFLNENTVLRCGSCGAPSK